MKSFISYLNKPFIKHFIFWVAVYSFYFVSYRIYYDSTGRLLFKISLGVVLQILTAYGVLNYIIPRYQKNKNKLEFIVSLLVLLMGMNLLYILQQITFAVPADNTCYYRFKNEFGHLDFWEQAYSYKTNFFILSWHYLQPLLFLMAFQFYEKQQHNSEINEQKTTAELTALKHQLNPHFLFNTLNNLYTLALKKSDQTPEVIEKLADILDYMLYRCNDKYVSLQKEIVMLGNYIALEKVRYGDRVNVSFEININKEVKIAPLILVTFIENAFKHGLSQELKEAFISIKISLEGKQIIFNIENSKSTIAIDKPKEECIGLKNVQKQLALLYTNEYSLDIKDEENVFTVLLKLEAK